MVSVRWPDLYTSCEPSDLSCRQIIEDYTQILGSIVCVGYLWFTLLVVMYFKLTLQSLFCT